MLAPVLTLLFLALSLCWAVFLKAGVNPSDWVTTLLFVGCISFLYWLFVRRSEMSPGLKLWVRIAVWAVPCYLLFQLIPLPISWLESLSPARAALARALTPVAPEIVKAPLSVNPPAALLWLFTFIGYLVTFFLARELSWRFSLKPWTPALPLMAIAACEAGIGIFQAGTGAPGEIAGTYTNHEHFCGLLEMVLPLTVVYGLLILRRRYEFESSVWRAMMAGTWAVSALLLTAIILSLSRMGLVSALGSLLVVAALSLGPQQPSRKWRFASLGGLGGAILLILVLFPPDQLIERFAEISASDSLSSDMRLSLWKETLPLIGEFRWFGSGLGGFESTFLKYQGVANAYRAQMAHNDYLQYLAELGVIGFSIFAAALSGLLAPVARGIIQLIDEDRRLLVIGCGGSFAAIALHSLVDYNTYIPANAMTLAWIAGIASINGLE